MWEGPSRQVSPPPDVERERSQGLGGWHSRTPPHLPFVLALWPSKCQLASPQIRAGVSPLSSEAISPDPSPQGRGHLGVSYRCFQRP